MNPMAVAVIAAWLACLVLEVAFLLWDSRWTERWRRPHLQMRFTRSNLAPMLERHGVDHATFAAGEALVDLTVHVERCEHCVEKKRCGEALATEHPLEGRMHFCPNEKLLERLTPP
jgi:hypothetical protein